MTLKDKRFLRSFEDASLPMEQWHHREHIKVAYLYLLQYSFAEALDRLRDRLRSYNTIHNVPDLPNRGYHETLTVGWLRLVEMTLLEYGPAASADEFLEHNPQLCERKALRLFYSVGLMMSPQAKTSFVEPDLAPLPRSLKRPTRPGA